MSYDRDRIYELATTLRDLEDLGAVTLTPGRTTGFGARPTVRRTQPRPVSPGSGGPVDDWSGAWAESRKR